MNREEQKEIREVKKLVPIEIRKQRKQFDFQYAHGFLYRFEGDFLYTAIIDLPSNRIGVLNTSTLIKPWILNKIYWEIQQMNMEEMLSQPKSFHVRGAFTINDIYFRTESMTYDKNDFSHSINDALSKFDSEINEHKKRLTNIHTISEDVEGYKISNLTKSIVLIYEGNYEEALDMLLLSEQEGDVYKHVLIRDGNGKSAKDFAIEYCQIKLQP